MTSVKIVTVDYYMSYPVKDLDVCYSEFRGTEVRQVPVLQIFGSTPEGTKTCLHIHGVLPYIYIPYDGVEPAPRMSYQLAAEIDRTLNISLGQASASTCFVHNIVLVSGIPLYGYHEKEYQYFKIFFYNPMIVKKACSLLENGVILGKHFQPHESHINYVLQFMIDYNLQGMNYINLSRVMYRMDTENPHSLDTIPMDQILPASVQRRSFSRWECDAVARDIMNIEEVCSGQLAVNPGLAALWEDEKQRRRNKELDSQISFCLTQDRAVPKSTATHRLFKQKLREKLAHPSSVSDDSVRGELERSVYPAETPGDADLLNASVVLSNALTTPSNGLTSPSNALTTPSNGLPSPSNALTRLSNRQISPSNAQTSLSNETIATELTSTVIDRADMSVLHLLQDLKADADVTVFEDSLIESSQQEQDEDLLKLLQELREGANVEEDSILSQVTVVQDTSEQHSSDDEQDEQNLTLPLVKMSETNEFDDDDAVWENSYWDEHCELPQMDGQYDNNSSNSGSDDEIDDKLPVTADIAQAVQMADDKHYPVNMADFFVSENEDADDINGEQHTSTINTDAQYYPAAEEHNDNCSFPATNLAMSNNDTRCSSNSAPSHLRKANEVYLGQNHRATLSNRQLLTPGINVLKLKSPHKTTAAEEQKKKIKITKVIVNPGLNVSVARLAKDLTRCKVHIGSKTIDGNNEKHSNALPGNNTNNDMKSRENSLPGSKSNNDRKTADSSAIIVSSPTTNSVNDTDLSSKDTEPEPTSVNRRKRKRKYPSFTKPRHRRSKTKSVSYRYKKPEQPSAETYDLRPKQRRAEPHGQTCFCCRAEIEASYGTGCGFKRKRPYRKGVAKTSNDVVRKAQDGGVENSAALESTTDVNNRAVVQPGNRPVDRTEEHREVNLAQTSHHLRPRETRKSETCADDELSMSDVVPSVRTYPLAAGQRLKRKHAAQCEHRMRRIQELEDSDWSSEAEEQRKKPLIRVTRSRKKSQMTRLKKIQHLRALHRRIRQVNRAVTGHEDDTMRLAMRFKRLRREHSDNSEPDSAQSYYCEIIGSTNSDNTDKKVEQTSLDVSSSAQLDRSSYLKICDSNCDDAALGHTESQTRNSNSSPKDNDESSVSQSNREIQAADDKQSEQGIGSKKYLHWNVDGANDTLSSSDSSVPEQPSSSRVTRRRKLSSKSNKFSGDKKNVSSDSDNKQQTRSKAAKQLPAAQQCKSTKLVTKQLQVSLVPLEFLITKSSDKHALPTQQQLDKTALNANNTGKTLIKASPHKSKQPTRTSPRFSTLSVTIRSPKSKRQRTTETDLKRIKIAESVKKCDDASGKEHTMQVDRHVRSGELQMIGIIPIIQNSNTGKKPQNRGLLQPKTTCDIVNQNNPTSTTSIISEPAQCDNITVKKQLFTHNKPSSRKTIIVNINTDTNTTFVEEHKVCAYEKSQRNSTEPKFVQIERLKDLIAKEEKFPATTQRDNTTNKMDDDTFNFRRQPEAVPPTDIFEPTCDETSSKDTCDLFSDANSAANLRYFIENTLAQQQQQHRAITSTSSDIYSGVPIAFNDRPVRKTRLDTPYEYNDFSSSDNRVAEQYEEVPEDDEDPPAEQQVEEQEEEERWYPVICYENELTVAQLYDVKCGFAPQPCTSAQVETSFIRCCARLHNTEYERSAEQAAIMQSLLEQHAKKTEAELAEMPYDPEYDGAPIVEEPADTSLPYNESVDSETLVSSSTEDDSLMVNNTDRTSYTIQEVEDGNDISRDDSPKLMERLSSSYSQPDLNKVDLLGDGDKTEMPTGNDTNSIIESSEVLGDIPNDEKSDEDTIIEATPPKSPATTQIFTVLHTTSMPDAIKTRMLMPKYLPPSRQDIMSSLAEYNIPECHYQEPFYSNAADVTGKMDVGHNVLRIPSNTIQHLEEFKSCTGFPGLDAWRRKKFQQLYPDVDVSKINFHITFAGQTKVCMVPGAEPPTRGEIEQWLEDKRQAASVKETPVTVPKAKMIIPLSPNAGYMDDSMSETMTLSPCTPDVVESPVEISQATPKHNTGSFGQRKASGNLQRRALFSQSMNKPFANKEQLLNLSDTSCHNNSHQITGVNLNSMSECKVDFQNAKALSEPQNLTIMVVEIHVRTRVELYPDPQHDPVRAIFYSVLNDMPAGTELLSRDETGVLVVNTLDDNSSSNLLDGSGVTCSVLYVKSEAELMAEFVQLVRKWDPDICAGYEIEMNSLGYLIERCNVLGVNLTSELSRLNPAVVKARHNPDTSDKAQQKDIQIPGRVVLDVWRLMRHEVALQSYTFENIMYHILHRRVPKFSYQRLSFYWEYKRNFHRHITAHYYIDRVKSVLQMLDQLDLIGRTAELAKLFGIQFYEVLSRGSQFRVESMMLRLAKPLNYIPVSPSVQQRAKMRAPEFLPLIFEPESRFYADPVIVLDFQSLYPSIIIAYNYCFSTCVGRVEMLGSNQPFEFGACQLKVPRETLRSLEHKLNFSPCGVGFVKPEVRQGILPRMLKEILETRLMVKSSMKENRADKLLQRVLHSRQLGLKLIANVTYGYTAANFSGRMPCIEVGDSVVSKGRETLERAIKLIEQTPEWRAKVVYGDTDSLFVMVAGRSKAEAFRIGSEIAEAVTNDNPAPVKLKLEKVFLPCILQTKKRYVGYMYESAEQQEPEYCAKGIETVRRDGCPAVAKMLENTLRTLFETRDMSLVKRYVCRQFSKLLAGRVSVQDLTFAREYRGASGYRPGACVPALVLARKWAVTDKRREPRRGERVPYVIVNGPPGLPLIRLVRCPRELLADPSRLRPNAVYYITRVIAPALNRCFTLIGADVLTWYNEMPRRQVQLLPVEDTAENVKKSTISQYFATTSCAACGQQSRDGLCDACAQDPQQSVVVLYMKINNWERAYDEVSLICGSCCGRKTTDCNSLDCPVLYRLNQTRRDLRQVPYVRRQIAKFN